MTRSALSDVFDVAWRRLEQAAHDPRAAQHAVLARLMTANRDTVFGREHQFAGVASLPALQRSVPLAGYGRFRPYVDRMMAGEPDVLFRGRAVAFSVTTGTTGRPKHVPIPANMRDEYIDFCGPMFARHEQACPGHLDCSLFLSGMANEGQTSAGIPLSAHSAVVRNLFPELDWFHSVPEPVFEAAYDARYYFLLAFTLRKPLRFLGAMDPSNILALFRAAEEMADRLITDLRRGGCAGAPAGAEALAAQFAASLPPAPDVADRLESSMRRHGRLIATEVWPLAGVVSWQAGKAAAHLRYVQEVCPGATLWPLVSGSTECALLIPLEREHTGGVPALHCTVFEMLPADEEPSDANLVPLEAARPGDEYRFAVTNGRGFYRYLMDDVFRVVGHHHAVPVFTFSHRIGHESSMVGEKLTESHVAHAIARFNDSSITGFEMTPVAGRPPRYLLSIEFMATPDRPALLQILQKFDRYLADASFNYKVYRREKLLGPPALVVVPLGTFADRRRALSLDRGRSDAQIKLLTLHTEPIDSLPPDAIELGS